MFRVVSIGHQHENQNFGGPPVVRHTKILLRTKYEVVPGLSGASHRPLLGHGPVRLVEVSKRPISAWEHSLFRLVHESG